MEDSLLIPYLKLPFQFEVDKLKHELALLLKSNWVPHFNQQGYEGAWNSIALYAKGGDAANILALHNTDLPLKATPALENCPYLNEVIQQFKCPLISARLLRLEAGAYIKPHRDYKLGYEDNNFRIHIPIITHKKIDFILDGQRLAMHEGECWYTNVNYVHSVANRGTTDRIHLVIDGERNDWSDELFFSLAPKEHFFPKEGNNYSLAIKKRIIEELERINTEGAEQVIQDLQAKKLQQF